MLSYANTSMYQPSNYYNQSYQSNYNTGLSTGFSLSNYTDTTSIFGGQSMNTGSYSQQCMAPQQQNSNETFMQQLVLMLLSYALQNRNQSSTTTEETIIEDEDIVADKGGKKDGASDLEKGAVVAATVADPIGGAILGDVFGGW